MRRLRQSYYLLLMLCLGCEERIQLTLSTSSSDLLVVEGVMTNERKRQLIKITHTYEESNAMGLPVSGATVTISDASQTYPLTEIPNGSGMYYTDTLIAVVATPYTLVIQYAGKQFTAQDSAVPVEPLPVLQYHAIADSSWRTMDFQRSGTESSYTSYDLNWKSTAFCLSGDCAGKIFYYDLKTIDANDIFKPAKEEFDFPKGTTVVRVKHSTSAAYQAFLRGVLSETEWRGGIFDVEQANAPTNLSKGAIGFFAVTSVVSDTIVIQ